MATQSLDQSNAAAPTANPGTGNDGQFHISNGQIIDPSGNDFVAKGINVQSDQVDPATLYSTFPGLNAVRVPTAPGADLGSIDNMVNQLTSKGVVVMLEDHTSSGGNPNTLRGSLWLTRRVGMAILPAAIRQIRLSGSAPPISRTTLPTCRPSIRRNQPSTMPFAAPAIKQ